VNSLGDWGVEPTVGRLLQTTQYPPQIKNHPTHPNKPTNRTRHAPINSKNTAPLFPIHPLAKQRRGWQAYPLPGPLGAMDGAHEPPRMGSRRVPAGGKPASPHGSANSKETSSALWLCALALRFGSALLPCALRFEKNHHPQKNPTEAGFFRRSRSIRHHRSDSVLDQARPACFITSAA